MKKITLGILAHVDSGKTTLSESILYKTGVIRSLGRVDYKNAYLDSDELERERGITIFSSQAVFTRGELEFTLLDTPGHIDFSPEMERTLRVLDCAILVVSGSDGVQSHTETLVKLLESYRIPTFVFINKMDISPYPRDELLAGIRRELGDGALDFSRRSDAEFAESLAYCSEELMEAYLAGEPLTDEMIKRAVSERKISPCAFGSALRSEGIEKLLDLLVAYAPEPRFRRDFSAKVFKITESNGERLTHLKVTGGKLRVKDVISGRTPDGTEWSEKINAIRVYNGTKFKAITEADAGTVCAVTGLTATYPGEGLGGEPDSGAAHLEPVLSYTLLLPEGVDVHTAYGKLRRLGEENPELHIDCVTSNGESSIRVRIMGEVQLEVLTRLILERYGMEVAFADGGISYRETIAETVIGVGHYEPLRHYAEVQLKLEPLERGAGVVFECALPENQLELNWQRLILTHLREKEHIGVLTGSPITDMKVSLVAGRAHQKHTEGGDFRQATYRAVRQGLMRAKSVLLEPWYDFRIELPSDGVGRVMTDITMMGGTLGTPTLEGEMSVVTGSAPVSELRSYHRELIGFTKGRGRIALTVAGWRECHNSDEVVAAYGYEPERDVENTADSVFCSHGAGVVIKWDEVDAHKHLTPDLSDGLIEPDAEYEPATSFERYMRAVATDAELLSIFEKTYGPIKKRVANEPRKIKPAPSPKVVRAPRSYSGKEYLLIDGYNIIFAWDSLRELSRRSLDMAREELISRICNYRGFVQCEIILVFDAYKVKNNPGELEKRSGITVVYTREAETADTYIEKVTHELAKSNRVRVATSDGQEQLIILGSGAIRVSAGQLLSEVESVELEIRSMLASGSR